MAQVSHKSCGVRGIICGAMSGKKPIISEMYWSHVTCRKCLKSRPGRPKPKSAWIPLPSGPQPRRGRRYIVKVKVGGNREIWILGGRYSGHCLWSLDLPLGAWKGTIIAYMKVPK